MLEVTELITSRVKTGALYILTANILLLRLKQIQNKSLALNTKLPGVLQGSCWLIHLSSRKELFKQQPEIAPSYKV